MAISTRSTPLLWRQPEHDIERVPFDDLWPEFIGAWGWPRGRREVEHLGVYGRSRAGKSTFILTAMDSRHQARGSHGVGLVTKRDDAVIKGWGWPIVNTWPPGYGQDLVIYWAHAKGITRAHRIPQRAKVATLLDGLWVPNANIMFYIDESPFVQTELGLKTELDPFYREGAAMGITMIGGQQRPAGTSRYTHSEPGWTASFKPKDEDDRDRIAEIFGDRKRYRAALGDLDVYKREFLLKSDVTGEAYISNLPDLKRRLSGRDRAEVHSRNR